MSITKETGFKASTKCPSCNMFYHIGYPHVCAADEVETAPTFVRYCPVCSPDFTKTYKPALGEVTEFDPYVCEQCPLPTTQKKPTNPKDAIGSLKPPLSCIPSQPLFILGAALLSGSLKYGRHNYRAIGVRSSVYYDACLRHLMSWWEGEDTDPESGVHHLGHAMACLVILLDVMETDLLNDDRPPVAGELLSQELRDLVKKLIESTPSPVSAYTRSTPGGVPIPAAAEK
jgi:hypothetical protein